MIKLLHLISEIHHLLFYLINDFNYLNRFYSMILNAIYCYNTIKTSVRNALADFANLKIALFALPTRLVAI